MLARIKNVTKSKLFSVGFVHIRSAMGLATRVPKSKFQFKGDNIKKTRLQAKLIQKILSNINKNK
jgi:hypothetical protein